MLACLFLSGTISLTRWRRRRFCGSRTGCSGIGNRESSGNSSGLRLLLEDIPVIQPCLYLDKGCSVCGDGNGNPVNGTVRQYFFSKGGAVFTVTDSLPFHQQDCFPGTDFYFTGKRVIGQKFLWRIINADFGLYY